MPSHRRKGLLAQRRRHDDEGEEDGSAAGDFVDYASTAGSLSTFAEDDGDASHVSNDDQAARPTRSPKLAKQGPVSRSAQAFRTTADTEAMMNGLKVEATDDSEVLNFDDATAGQSGRSAASKRPQPVRTRSQPTESVKQRSNGQNLRNATQNRYFLHDDRHREQVPSTAARGRGRGSGQQSGRGGVPQQPVHDAVKQWTHDLHETINDPSSLPQASAQIARSDIPAYPKTLDTHKTPNRSFSTTTVLGNVSINISLPGLERKTKVMVKKHYTLLPQHRPPLRRDKPVRISIPDEHPRYIFPSTERSFIFIPRAMRPNQQFRARGRGSFHGSRRPSLFSYTPSVGMSRRPSVTASNSGSGMHTPTGPLPYQADLLGQRPVVRMPTNNLNIFVPTAQQAEVFMGDNSAIIHSPSANLPMHQPIPQKTVSVADIESPTRAPPQQSQQPFHQQMSQVPDPSKMPHIPEGAIYAQPFQPFPNAFQPQYYGHSFQPGMAMHPDYSAGLGGPVMSVQQPQQAGTEQHQQQMPLTYESNGMVYYYDPSQQFMPSSMMMQQYYYPAMQNQMFYQ